MTKWYSRMTAVQKRTFWACWGGWAMDGMDVQIYALVIPALATLWHMTQPQAGLIGTTALVTSAVGGMLAGLLADRIGRVRVLQITILWFAVFTGLSALTQNHWQLLLARGMQGLGFGGEWAAGTILVGEVADPKSRGRMVGTVQGGWPVGYAVAALAYVSCFYLLPEGWAWRALFVVGVLPALSVLWLRRSVPDSKAYLESAKGETRPGLIVTMRMVFSPQVARATAAASLLATGALGGNYTVLTWLVTLLKQDHNMSVGITTFYLSANIAGSFCGYMGSAALSDALGRRTTFVLSATGAIGAVLCYTLLPVQGAVLMGLGFVLGMFQSGIVGGMGACFTELFPTRIRASAGGFSYNLGRGVGSLVPAAVGLTSDCFGLGHAIGGWAVASYLLVFLGALLMPSGRGYDLRESA